MSPIAILATVIFGIVALCVGVALVIRLRHFVTALRAERWKPTRGRILESRIARMAGGWLYKPEVVYEYHADGRRYVDRTISAASELPIFPSAQERAQKYPQGRDVTVYYDPKHPDHAVLERTGAMTINAYMIGLIFVLLMSLYGLATVTGLGA